MLIGVFARVSTPASHVITEENIMNHKNKTDSKRTFARLGSAVLALLMLGGVIATLASCAKPDGGDGTKPDTTTAAVDVDETTNDIYKDVPTGNFNDEEFHILNDICTWALTTMESSDQLGDTISDAVTNRNGILEQQVGVKLVINTVSNVNSDIRKDQDTTTNQYDCFFDPSTSNVKLAVEGRLVDFNELKDIDLTKEWWYPTSTRNLAIGPAVYMVFSDIHLYFHESFYVSIFNKDMFANYPGLEDPYELVKSGNWTIDKLTEMMKVVASDVDANGKKDISESTSIYGLVAHTNAGYSMMVGFDNNLLEYDDQHIPQANFTGVGERFIDSYNKVKNTMYDTVLCGSPISEGYSKLSNRQHTPFSEGRALFMYEVTGTLKEHRDESFSYGIVTSPKYNAEQKEYISPITCSAASMCVPVGCKDLDRVGVVLENMAAVSHKVIKPAYYNITLCYKYNKDPAAIEMLDMVYKNGRFELAYVYNFGGLRSTVETAFKTGVSDISGQVGRSKKLINRGIEDAIKGLKLN